MGTGFAAGAVPKLTGVVCLQQWARLFVAMPQLKALPGDTWIIVRSMSKGVGCSRQALLDEANRVEDDLLTG